MQAPTSPLTPSQQRVYDFIKAYMEQHKYAPTYREIAAGIGVRSTNGIADLLLLMERKGWLKRGVNRARTIVLWEHATPTTGDPDNADAVQQQHT
jgi:repressor LexA